MRRIHPRVLGILLLAAMSTAFGCGDETTVNVVTPDGAVVATVSGRVIAHPSGLPVPDAVVEILGNASTLSDSTGTYRLEELGPGNYDVLVGAPGHARSRVSVVIAPPTIAGTVETNLQRDLFIIEATASLSAQLYLGTGTGTAANATATLGSWAFPFAASGHAIDHGAVPIAVEADSAGLITLAGLPATAGVLTVAPYDLDGDGVADFLTTPRTLDLRPGQTSVQSIVLATNPGGIGVVQSNMPSFGAPLQDAEYYFVFSTNMDEQATTVLLDRVSFPSGPVDITTVWPTSFRVEIAPTQALEDGARYSIQLLAVSASGLRRTFSYQFEFRSDGGGGTGGDCPDFVTDLALTAPGPAVDFDTTVLQLEWTAVPCAGGYSLFAKDDRNNTSGWVFLKNEPADYEFGTIVTSVTLPPSFDLYQADGFQTPFAGINVTLAAVPLEATDPSVDSGHGQLTLRDTVGPGIESAVQLGNGQNTSAAPAVLSLSAVFTEYIDPSSADPVIQIVEAGGDPGFALDPATGSWSWDNGRRSGKYSFTLAPGVNASGDQYQIIATDLTDFTLNVSSGQTMTPPAAILATGGMFDFEGSQQGWTVAGTGWEWGTPASGPTFAHSGVSLFGTDLDANTQPGWLSRLTSPPLLVPATNPSLEFWYWSWFGGGHFVRLYVNGQSMATFASTRTSWTLYSLPLSAFAGQLITVALEFDSRTGSTFSNAGMFVDDVAITGGP